MNRLAIAKKMNGGLLILALVLLMTGVSSAAEFWLRVDAFDKVLPGPTSVRMWGFAQCTTNFATCSGPTVPGPQLIIPPGDTTLIVHLNNNLGSELFREAGGVLPVSIVIPGQTATMSPVKFPDSAGRQKVRSFTAETPLGGANTYTWSNLRPGTYLYHSGTHPQVQVQMGLYGAVKHDAAALNAYTGIPYDTDVVLLFSEIDPVLHANVDAGTYGTPPPAGITSTIDFKPRYFLINGEPFTAGSPPIFAGRSGERTLIRFLNAGLRDYVPVLQGLYMDILSEDGNLLPYPRKQYSLLLSAGKTVDAMVIPSGGLIPVYDRRLNLTNNGISSGGLLTHLEFGESPDMTVTPPSFDFGPTPAGTVPVQTFTIANNGLGGLLVGQISLTGTDAAKFSIVNDTCSLSPVVSAGSCTVGVGFHPTYIGLKTAVLTIPSNDLNAPHNVPLSGTEALCAVTFADVPSGYIFEDQIKAMYCNNITAGCSTAPLNFCPMDNVTRKEAAVFITNAMNQAPAATCTETVFNDVNAAAVGTGFCRYIEAFSTLGITSGCQADNPLTPDNEAMFCPEGNVTRKEAAVFITKAMGQAPAATCTGTVFNDVNAATVGEGFCRYIEAFSTLGITGGCQADNPLTPENEAMFCPDALVSRGQIAVFLTNGFLN
jgi:FtsP/CotA-like multicopper oxidase with cupredoxin domain